MPKLSDVCRYVRSKNAGPFWITVDLFFRDSESFERYASVKELQPESLGVIFGVRPDQVGCYPVANLAVLKISYPRKDPQGGMIERDLHGGQQYVRILDLELTGS
jgi:hypothetical protein